MPKAFWVKAVQAGHDSQAPVALVSPEKCLFYLAPSECHFPVAAAPLIAHALGVIGPVKAKPWSFSGSPFPSLRWGSYGTLMQDPAVTLAKVSWLAPAWLASLLISRSGHFLSSQTLVLPFPCQGFAKTSWLAAKPC